MQPGGHRGTRTKQQLAATGIPHQNSNYFPRIVFCNRAKRVKILLLLLFGSKSPGQKDDQAN